MSISKKPQDTRHQSDRGLTSQQVQERQQQYGLNELTETAGRSNFQILMDQFTNIMLVLLIAVAIISGFLDYIDLQAGKTNGVLQRHDRDYADRDFNGVLGYLQESRAKWLSPPWNECLRPRWE